MARINKKLAVHGMVNFLFIMMAVRQSDVGMFTMPNRAIGSHESSDGGSTVLVAPAIMPSTLYGHSRKSLSRTHDAIIDEYDRIMQDVRSQSPAIHGSNEQLDLRNNAVTTMVLGIPESPGGLAHGGLQLSRRPTDGAVGGFVQSFMNDENLDIFNNFIPGNMREDEIDELISNDEVPSLDQAFPDINWQQFISDYDQFTHGACGITKSVGNSISDWSTTDLLTEAIHSSELFLPMPASSQNSSEFRPTTDLSTDDPVVEARLEMMEFNEWASQDHQEDMLFPSLPPPSYQQVTQSEKSNATSPEMPQPVSMTNHLHDHNYYNASSPRPNVEDTNSVQSASYAIRSRHEVSTRVISIPPRPRHVSSSAESSSSSTMDEAIDFSEASSIERFPSSRDITDPDALVEISEQSSTFDSFVIKPVNLTYFDNISKTVGARREVILCN